MLLLPRIIYAIGQRAPLHSVACARQAEHKVYVSLEAEASSLFPAILDGIVVRGEGEAEVRIQSH